VTGWNLPPGCNVSDLPGNSAADAEYEAWAEDVYERLTAALKTGNHYPVEVSDALFKAVEKLCTEAYCRGYDQARADEAEAAFYKEQARLAAERGDG
jgi:hypothetical protein